MVATQNIKDIGTLAFGTQGADPSPTFYFRNRGADNVPFALSIGGADFTFGGTTVFDPVLYLGYNTLGGGRVDATKARLALSFEADYWNNNVHAMEINIDFLSPDGTKQSRPMAFAVDRDNGAGTGGYQYWLFGIGNDNSSQFAILNYQLTTTLFTVRPVGSVYMSGSLLEINGSFPIIKASDNTSPLGFSTANVVRMYIDNARDGLKFGNADQTLLYRSAGTTLRTNSTLIVEGPIATAKIAAPADADVGTSQAYLWFDNTNGAGKLMVKAKTANGTVVTGSVTLA